MPCQHADALEHALHLQCPLATEFQRGVKRPLLSLETAAVLLLVSPLSQMCHLEKLESLVLRDNNLCDVPRLLAAFLRRLRVIDLSRNRFKRIPPVLAALTGLQSVDLSANADLEACPLPFWSNPITPHNMGCLRAFSYHMQWS